MNGLLLTVGFILQVFYFTLFVIYIRNRRAKKRVEEKLYPIRTIDFYEGGVERVRSVSETEETGQMVTSSYGVIGTSVWQSHREKEDFIPKKNNYFEIF